jgi:hypothetical protein
MPLVPSNAASWPRLGAPLPPDLGGTSNPANVPPPPELHAVITDFGPAAQVVETVRALLPLTNVASHAAMMSGCGTECGLHVVRCPQHDEIIVLHGPADQPPSFETADHKTFGLFEDVKRAGAHAFYQGVAEWIEGIHQRRGGASG